MRIIELDLALLHSWQLHFIHIHVWLPFDQPLRLSWLNHDQIRFSLILDGGNPMVLLLCLEPARRLQWQVLRFISLLNPDRSETLVRLECGSFLRMLHLTLLEW